jgi:hypothetical protein
MLAHGVEDAIRMRLRMFRDRLAALMGDSADGRPFVCDGDPYACRAFVIGINPASSVPFWPFWDDEAGFDRARWHACYLARRAAEPLRPGRVRRLPISPTRRTLGWIAEAASPVRILETNLYVEPTPEAAALATSRRHTRVLEFLLEEIRPQAVLLHGREVAEQFQEIFSCRVGTDFVETTIQGRSIRLAATRHLSRGVSRVTAERLGEAIRDACAT